MKRVITFSVLMLCWLCIGLSGKAQGPEIRRVDPSNWWVGMKNRKLQLLVYGEKLSVSKVSLKSYRGVRLQKVSIAENPDYLFLDLLIDSVAKPGAITLVFENASGKTEKKYELKARSGFQPAPVTQSDFMYLLMPDRFANGDPANDRFKDMADTASDRNNPWLRHGGDLKGITERLDYFKELGVTTLWLNPVVENDQPVTNEGGSMRSAYHGYGFTDHYQVDKRLGGNEAYRKLIDEAHRKGLKIVQDAVYNHVGINHWMVRDLPMKDWLNQWETYTNTSYKDQALLDPHASAYDRKVARDGWFVPFLPDLNHSNPFVANYLIQHALWTVENFNIDAWRIDTYFYNDMEFMNRCNQALLDEYPEMFIFGESWVNSVPNQAYFTRNHLNIPFKCNQPGTVDFQLYFAINAALNEKPGWNEGVQKLYQVLAQDYLYENPSNLVTFLDNHDLDRFLSVVGEDEQKFRTGMIWLMTIRGIPQLYYGTEILMKNFKNPSDAEVRKDFPGGWAGDPVNKFTRDGRTLKENEAFDLVKKLALYRRESKALSEGKFIQFTPFDDGIYAYFRVSGNEKVMIVSNTGEQQKTFSTARFREITGEKPVVTDMLNNRKQVNFETLTLGVKETLMLEIK